MNKSGIRGGLRVASFFMVMKMFRYLSGAILTVLISVASLQAAECTVQTYSTLVAEGKSADEGRQWNKSVEIYSRLVTDCASSLIPAELVKAYDALSIARLMTENYSAAIETAGKCLELDNRFNSCMITAAKGYENLGDRDMAISFASSAIEVGGYDDYSSAVVIFAKSYLKKLQK